MLDASDQSREASRWPADRLAEAAPSLFWTAKVPMRLDAQTAPDTEAVEVYINEGRWIAGCPDCNGAQLAAREDKRFMCNECANIAVGGLWRPVVWPQAVAAIEEVLEVREDTNANWLPGETVADLLAENVEHGLGDLPAENVAAGPN